jgi:hypothetical protein
MPIEQCSHLAGQQDRPSVPLSDTQGTAPSAAAFFSRSSLSKVQQGSVGSLRVVPKERDVVTPEKIKAGLIYFGGLLHSESRPEDITRLSIAGRRIISAYNETDLVDRFCDLWEACEVLCPKSKHLNGKIDNRISQALGTHTGFKHNKIKKLVMTGAK